MLIGWIGIGATLIIANLFFYFGYPSFDQAIINNYSKKYEILDEKNLLKYTYLFRIINGSIVLVAGVFHKFHNSCIVSIFLCLSGFTLSYVWYYNQKKKYLSRKNQEM